MRKTNKMRKTIKMRKINKIRKTNKMRKINKMRKTYKRKRRGGGVEEDNLVDLTYLKINPSSDRTKPFAVGVTTPEGRKNELDKMERKRQAIIANQTKIATAKMKKSIKNKKIVI